MELERVQTACLHFVTLQNAVSKIYFLKEIKYFIQRGHI